MDKCRPNEFGFQYDELTRTVECAPALLKSVTETADVTADGGLSVHTATDACEGEPQPQPVVDGSAIDFPAPPLDEIKDAVVNNYSETEASVSGANVTLTPAPELSESCVATQG